MFSHAENILWFCSYFVSKIFVQGNERTAEAPSSLTGRSRRRVARMQRMHRASSGALRRRYK